LSLTPTTPDAGTIAYPDGEIDPFTNFTAQLKGLSTYFTANALTWTNPATGEATPGPAGVPAAAMLAGSGIPYDALGNVYTGYFQSPLFPTGGAQTDAVTFRLIVPAAGPGPYPVAIFQHGITSSKNAALAIANSLAKAGYATLAIDAIYHGERTEDGADSGDGFFSLNLLQSRANVYQAAVDLWETVDVFSNGIDLNGDTAADLDSSHIEFVAHSLGTIIGSAFLSQETRVEKMVLCSPASVLVNVLDESSEPVIQEIVASLGDAPGTAGYYGFLDLAQWLMDPADASFLGIGDNPQSNLMTLYAYGDPIVAPASSQVFLTNLGMDLTATTVVDPDNVGVSFPGPADLTAGAYQYGLKGKPVVHSFLLRPTVDLVAEPYYAGYSEALQVKATTGSQMQVAGFLMP
jgi:pimeloyl-ACP methyl ester carboxylesterase